jgi:hypothetical protein
MGRHYRENPVVLDAMLKSGRIAMPGGSFAEYVEVGDRSYSIGMLAEALQPCVDDRTRGGLITKFAARFMELHRANNQYCHIEETKEGKVYIIDGSGIDEFLSNNLKRYFRHEGTIEQSTHARWKQQHSGTGRQQRNYELHRESVDDLVERHELVHAKVVDGCVVLPQGECDEQEFLDLIVQVSGRSLYGRSIENKQHEFFAQKVYTIHNALLGPPHEVRALPTERIIELLPPGFEKYYRFEQLFAETG